jgi:hypothetical protein
MATTKNWTGAANNGVFNDLGNWDDATAFANSDTYKIGATNQNIAAVTHAFTGITLIVTEGFGGMLGSPGGPISFSSVAAITYAGKGQFAAFSSAGTITTASFEHTTGQVYISGGTWTQLTNSTGNMDISSSAVVTRLDNIAGNIVAGYNATVFANLFNGGNLVYSRDATNVYALRGLTVQKNNGTTTATKVVTTLWVMAGATYNKQSSGTESPAASNYNIFPGAKYTVSGNSGPLSTGTTVDIGAMTVWGGAKVNITGVPGVTFVVSGITYKGTAGSERFGDFG